MRTTIGTFLTRGAVYGLLHSWLAVTVLRQVDAQSGLVRRLDPFNFFIPVFRFFGPNPGTTDTHVLVRTRRRDGTPDPWRQLRTSQGARRWRHVLWSPGRRVDKAVFDLAKGLHRSKTLDYPSLRRTIVYRALLNMAVHGVDHDPGAASVQFALGRSAAFDSDVPPEVTFVSEFHDLPAAPAEERALPEMAGQRPREH